MKLKRISANTNYWTLYNDRNEAIQENIWLGVQTFGVAMPEGSLKLIVSTFMEVGTAL